MNGNVHELPISQGYYGTTTLEERTERIPIAFESPFPTIDELRVGNRLSVKTPDNKVLDFRGSGWKGGDWVLSTTLNNATHYYRLELEPGRTNGWLVRERYPGIGQE